MNRQKIIAGIDIGTSKVVTLIAKVSEEEVPSVVGVANIESRGIRKGQIVDIDEATETVVTSLEAAERMAGYQINSAFISVGGTHISSQNSHGVVAVAEPNKEITENDVLRVIDAAKAVSLAPAREIMHVIPRFFVVDSQDGIKDPVGMSGIRLEVNTHLITGGTTAMKNIEKCISRVGIDVSRLAFNGLLSAESVLTDTEKELGVVLLDIGAGTTDVAIFVEGSLSYSAVIPVGARNVTNDLAIGLRISLESAEKIKTFLGRKSRKISGLEGESEQLRENQKEEDEVDVSSLHLPEEMKKISRKTIVEGIIKPRLNEIFNLVSLEIKKSGFGGMTPAGIVLTGGGAKTTGILTAAKRSLAMPLRLGAPYDIKGLTDEILTPAFSTAVGLIKYGVDKEPKKFGLNLPHLPNFFKNAPLKGTAGRLIDLAKSFLP